MPRRQPPIIVPPEDVLYNPIGLPGRPGPVLMGLGVPSRSALMGGGPAIRKRGPKTTFLEGLRPARGRMPGGGDVSGGVDGDRL